MEDVMCGKISRLLLIAFLFTLFAFGEGNAGTGYVGSPLTTEEMTYPHGRYQCGIDALHRCRVEFISPALEPVPLKTVRTAPSVDDALVDGEGGIWYADASDGLFPDIVIRLNPDGSENFRLKLGPSPYENPDYIESIRWDYPRWEYPDLKLTAFAIPAVALNSAVIFYVGWDVIHDTNNTNPEGRYDGIGAHAYLECIDKSGQTRWRTNATGYNKLKTHAWRLDNERIAMVSSEFSFDIFKIATGEFIETVDVPGWSAKTRTGPILTDSGDMIIHCDDFERGVWDGIPVIYRVTAQGRKVWNREFRSHTFSNAITVSDNGELVYGNKEGLLVLDSESGDELWGWRGGDYNACGVLQDHTFLIGGTYMNKTVLQNWDDAGNRVWTRDIAVPFEGEDDVIIYSDGNILYGDGDGLTLLMPSGDEIWSLDNIEISGRFEMGSGFWRINPMEDGGLVLISNYSADPNTPQSIYILKQPEL